MKLPSTRLLLLNGAAALVMTAGAVAAVRHHVAPPQTAPCTERYSRMTSLKL